MVAIFFLIFDVEGAYIFSWAVASRPLGWAGWFQIEFFITVLIAGLVYVWVRVPAALRLLPMQSYL